MKLGGALELSWTLGAFGRMLNVLKFGIGLSEGVFN